jgi:hypothetical protein
LQDLLKPQSLDLSELFWLGCVLNFEAFSTSTETGVQAFTKSHHQLYIPLHPNLQEASIEEGVEVFVLSSILPGFMRDKEVFVKEQIVWTIK